MSAPLRLLVPMYLLSKVRCNQEKHISKKTSANADVFFCDTTNHSSICTLPFDENNTVHKPKATIHALIIFRQTFPPHLCMAK